MSEGATRFASAVLAVAGAAIAAYLLYVRQTGGALVCATGGCEATLALSAFLFSCYLLYVQLAVIGAICQWCVVTDALTSAIATTALLRLWIGEAQTGFKRHC